MSPILRTLFFFSLIYFVYAQDCNAGCLIAGVSSWPCSPPSCPICRTAENYCFDKQNGVCPWGIKDCSASSPPPPSPPPPSPPPPSSPPSSPSGAKNCNTKKGSAAKFPTAAALSGVESSLSWFYNWDPSHSFTANIEFVPMIWGKDTISWAASVIPAGSKVLLGFNEPQFKEQANMAASEAASRWPDIEKIAQQKGISRIGSPAVNWAPAGSYDTNPYSYLDAFFAACKNCKVDIVVIHWYGCSNVKATLQNYVSGFYKYGKPIWVTEFGCGTWDPSYDGTAQQQINVMKDAVAVFEADSHVERYSWFSDSQAIPNTDLVTSAGQLTAIGQSYKSQCYSSAVEGENSEFLADSNISGGGFVGIGFAIGFLVTVVFVAIFVFFKKKF